MITVGLVALAAAVARANGTAVSPPPVTGTLADMAGGLGVMCFAFIGIELASTMADEIRNPERDVPRSVVITGLISLAAYLLVADALLALVPAGELGAIQGVMQAVHQGAVAAGASLAGCTDRDRDGDCDRRIGVGLVRRSGPDPVRRRPQPRAPGGPGPGPPAVGLPVCGADLVRHRFGGAHRAVVRRLDP